MTATATAAIASRAYAQSSEQIKIALIGAGSRGSGACAQALSTDGPVKLVAMADVFEDRLENSLAALKRGTGLSRQREAAQLKDQIDVPPDRRFVGLDAYKHAIDAADVVLLTTPPHFRPIHFEYAVAAGKNVFMEKPVAVDPVGVRRVLAAGREADRRGLKVAVGLHRRHWLSYEQTIARVHAGEIGDLRVLDAYSLRSGTGKYWKRRPQQTEMEYQLRHWYYFTWLSGDFIVEQSIHMIDVCNWARGAFPAIAQGQGGRQVRNTPDYGHIYDHMQIEFTYEDGSRMISHSRHMKNCYNLVTERARGAAGTADFNNGVISDLNGNVRWRIDRESPNAFQVEHDVLFDAIRNNKPHNESQYAAYSTLTAIMGRTAAYTGQQITWKQMLESKEDLSPNRYTFDGTPPILPDENGVYPVAMPGQTQVL